MPADQEFLLYPLDNGEDPVCPRCGERMLFAGLEARKGKPDFVTFRCERCGRSEKFVCEIEIRRRALIAPLLLRRPPCLATSFSVL